MRQPTNSLCLIVSALIALASGSAMAQDPTFEEGLSLLGEGEYRKAWTRFQTVSGDKGASTETLNAMVRAAIPIGEYGVAADLAAQSKQLAKSASERVEAATLLGRVHLEASLFSEEHVASEKEAGIGYLDRAVAQFTEAIDASAALASEATYWLALSQLERGDNEAAAESAAAYLTQRPDGPYANAAQAVQTAANGDSDGMTPPVVKKPRRPEYSGKARMVGVKGMLVVQGVVDEKGRFNGVVLLKGIDPALDERVLEQVSRWRFEPAMADGQPTETPHRENVRMTLRGHDPSRQIILPE